MYVKVSSPNEASNLSNLLKDGDWMVLYYADWCGHCQTMKPEWQKVVNKMKSSNRVNVAEVESNHINSLINKPQVNGFPTIKMYNSGVEKANFEDERVADKMEKFAMSNTTHHSMKNHSKSPMVKKISHTYINPMKKIIKSILSRKTKKLNVPLHHNKQHKQHKQHKQLKPIMPSKRKTPSKPNMPSKRKTPAKARMSSKRKMSSKTKFKKSFRNSTKDVYSQLIKSFNRIGKEAEKDSKLLKNAVEVI